MLEQSFQPYTLTIRKLFTDSDSLYQIPQYQRPYKWIDEHVEKLWEDIYEAYSNDPEGNYFLGSIVTAKPTDKTSYKDIVDGQQRLTTLMILFCVIRDFYPNINEDSNDDSSVTLTVIKSAISLHDDKTRLKLFTHNSAKTDFLTNIINEGAIQELKKPSPEIMKKNLPINNFINSAVILRKKLEGLKFNDVQSFVNFIFNQVQIIRIDCKDVHFAIKLFQVINARGMDLASADLIKSFLLGEMKDSKDAPDILPQQQKNFDYDWSKIEDNMDNSDINIDELFTFYTYYKLAANPKNSTYQELQKAFKHSKKNSNEFIGEIKGFSDNYKNGIHLKNDKDIYALRYLPWTVHWRSIILTGLQTSYSDISGLIKLLSHFYYLYWIGGFTLTRVKQASFNIIKQVKNSTPVGEIWVTLEDKITKEKIIEKVIAQLKSNNIASEKWCKPLLLMLEYNETDNSKLSFIGTNSVHLEHVLPISHNDGKWGDVGKDVAERYLHSGGNLTLLSGPKNIAVKNKSFSKKIDAYKGKGVYAADAQNVTAFMITQKIVQDFEKKKEWDETAMKNRKEWFIKEAGKVLDIDADIKINPETDS